MVLRIGAVGIAIAGVADPACVRRERAPLALELTTVPSSDPDFPRAGRLRERVMAALGDRGAVDPAAAPQAVIAIGDAPPVDPQSAPVFALAIQQEPQSTSILDLRVPGNAALGQAVSVSASIRARGLAGRATSFDLQLGGAVVATVGHRWTAEEELFEPRFACAPPVAGVHRLRLVVRTEGVGAASVADAVVVTRERTLRLLAYESRPSWPLAFVRRSLEGDALFEVSASSRTSRGPATTSNEGLFSLDRLDVDLFDAILVGALDALTEPELGVLERFTSVRGGTLILLPDRRVSERLGRRFGIPRSEEALVEAPLELRGPMPLRAAELLLLPEEETGVQVLASARRGSLDRPVIVTTAHGNGRVLFSGALDAWRYRGEGSKDFDRFWRAVAADAALASPPRVAVSVVPPIVRRGEEVMVSVDLRATEILQEGRTRTSPLVSAILAGAGGRPERIRLWPGTRPGAYEGRLRAPRDGSYTVAASIEGASAEAPLLVASDVVRPARDRSAALTHAARASSGAVLSDPAELPGALASLEPRAVEKTGRPMRSPWWVIPFALLLCTEWGLRRRSGLK
jgi:hypothetical protein